MELQLDIGVPVCVVVNCLIVLIIEHMQWFRSSCLLNYPVFLQIKPIQRDMWCEIPAGAILETVYYRYLYFHEQHGKVLYALTTAAPHDMIRRIIRVLLNPHHVDRAVCHGTYSVHGKHATVTAQQEWQHVQFSVTLLPESHWGRWGALTLDRHLTSGKGEFDEYVWPNDITEFPVPTGSSQVFQYVYDRRL